MKKSGSSIHHKLAALLIPCVLFIGGIKSYSQPITAATTPTLPQSQAVSLYTSSGTYSDVPGVNFYEVWWGGQWTGFGDYTIPSTSSVVKGYQGLLFTGVGFESTPTNVAGCDTLHISLYTPNGNSFAVRLVDSTGHSADVTYTTNSGVIYSNSWIYLNIPISQFVAANPLLDLYHVFQLGWIINNTDENPGADYYIDNVYFSGSTNLTFDPPPPSILYPTNDAPIPTNSNVLAMYDSSGTYPLWPGSEGIDWNANIYEWSNQGSYNHNYVITNTGNIIMYMPALSFVGAAFSNPYQVDTTGYNTLHIDVWTPNGNQFGVQLVSLSPETQGPQVNILNVPTHKWFGIDIPLSQFTSANPNVDMTDIQQMLFLDNASVGGGVQGADFYVDNIYFYSNAPAAPTITAALTDASVLLGSNITMTVSALGSSLTYQWLKNGASLNDGGNVSGAHTTSLTLGSCQGSDEANYSVIVSNSIGTASSSNRLTVLSPAHLTIDPTLSWVGYMNYFELPSNGGAYVDGGPWAPADLDATFSGAVLTFTPNTSIDRDNPLDTFWWQDASGTSPGNKTMDANIYVQNDILAGHTITFTGYCWSNNLVAPYNTGTTVFIKDFAPDYSSSTAATAALVAGSAFSVTLTASPGDHIQYGFEMIGPDARVATAASLGKLVVSVSPPSLELAASGVNRNLSIPTEVGVNYTLLFKTNLTDSIWQTYTNFSGTGSSMVIPVDNNQGSSFFQAAY